MSAAIDRRSFVLACGALPLASACAGLRYANASVDGDALVIARSEFTAQPFAFVEHPALEFPIYVHQHGPNDFSAVLTRCMHRGCTVEPGAGHLVCPCHGSEYGLRGEVLKGPTRLPLITFATRADEAAVRVLEISRSPR